MKHRHIEPSSIDGYMTSPKDLLVSKVCALLLFSKKNLLLYGYSMLKEINDTAETMGWTYVMDVSGMAMTLHTQIGTSVQVSSVFKDSLELILLLLNDLSNTKQKKMSTFLSGRYKEFTMMFRNLTTN